MKFKSIKRKYFAIVALIFSLGIFFQSCKDNTVDPVPAPSVSLTSPTLQGIVGSDVTLAATVNAPGGLKSITVLKNGAAFDSKTYTGETSATYTKAYTIENLASGSVVNFTIIATDNNNAKSEIGTIAVTVSAIPAKQVIDVRGLLTGDVRWTKDKVYKLIGFVRVGGDTLQTSAANVATGTLTIEPGTIIIGDRATKGTLVIQRGSRIIANGTVTEPIVFTSERDPGLREPGDWGGLVICGKAVNNRAGGSDQLEGGYKAWHGGTVDTDNSGSLKYVRVEYAGIPINPNQEVNSFTFGSVGNATVMEYLQASFGLDDAFEWFGGTANAKYLVAYKGLDDDFDMDFGYRGTVQFAVGVRGSTQADQSGSNGFEVDNDGNGTLAEPFTAPTMANVSLIGPKQASETPISAQFQNGMHLRRNCRIKVYNTFVTAYPNGIFIDGATTTANALNGQLILRGVVVAGVNNYGANGFGTGGTVAFTPAGFPVRDVTTATPAVAFTIGTDTPTNWFLKQTANKLVANYGLTGLNTDVFGSARPNFSLNATATETITRGGTTLPAGLTPTDYVGAFKDTDWTATWTQFAPNTVRYR